MNLIAIKRKVTTDKGIIRETWNVNPLPSDIMQESDVLVLIGFNKDLEKLEA